MGRSGFSNEVIIKAILEASKCTPLQQSFVFEASKNWSMSLKHYYQSPITAVREKIRTLHFRLNVLEHCCAPSLRLPAPSGQDPKAWMHQGELWRFKRYRFLVPICPRDAEGGSCGLDIPADICGHVVRNFGEALENLGETSMFSMLARTS